VRFCISNHKQYANELAVSLSNSTHRLFYPSRDHLDLLKNAELQPLSMRLANTDHPLETVDKFRWMRVIAEAVLKFDVAQRVSHNLDAENMFFREFNSTYEIHWQIELLKPSYSPSSLPRMCMPAEAAGRCHGYNRGGDVDMVNISDTLRKLGALFLQIAISPFKEPDQEKALKKAGTICGPGFSNFLRCWLEGQMGQTNNDFGREEVQKLFYKQVIQRLRDRESTLPNGHAVKGC
jgi:hypothetical protein